ncbi:MAG TPA: hypothetical protein VHS33_08895 [Sphingomicrobium sp.]|nr:hypothetical protein [Sphingomicrobium sp.]
MPAPRERDAVLRGFAAALPRDAFEAPPVARFAVERFAGDLRALDARVVLPPADLARVAPPDVGFFEVALFAVAAALFTAGFFAVDFRAAAERFAGALRAGFDAPPEADPAEAEPSTFHLPDITRCAASATASAMIEPSLVALDTTLLAALSAVSAASSPASRIFFRAAGLALIAAAAAASPAASISLLIAALASLSTVVLVEPVRDDDELERDLVEPELLRADFAIFLSPSIGQKTL